MSKNQPTENFLEHEEQALEELKSFIASNPDPRELKHSRFYPHAN